MTQRASLPSFSSVQSLLAPVRLEQKETKSTKNTRIHFASTRSDLQISQIENEESDHAKPRRRKGFRSPATENDRDFPSGRNFLQFLCVLAPLRDARSSCDSRHAWAKTKRLRPRIARIT